MIEEKKLPPHNERFEIVEQSRWLPRIYKCGHLGNRWFRLHVYGEVTEQVRQRQRCSTCFLAHLKKHTIHCASCGLAIFPGEPAALYSLASPDLKIEIATVWADQSVVGCLRMSCCPSGGFFAGHWTEKGFKPAFTSGQSVAGEALRTGQVTVANF